MAIEHDPSASQATFVELAFGINILWAAFDRFSNSFSRSLSLKMGEVIAGILALESSNHNNETRLLALKKKCESLRVKNESLQKKALNVAKLLSLIGAIGCVIVLYFDLTGCLGKWAGILVLPLPIHVVSSSIIFGSMRFRIWWVARGYRNFVKEFEMSTEKIKEDVKSLKP